MKNVDWDFWCALISEIMFGFAVNLGLLAVVILLYGAWRAWH